MCVFMAMEETSPSSVELCACSRSVYLCFSSKLGCKPSQRLWKLCMVLSCITIGWGQTRASFQHSTAAWKLPLPALSLYSSTTVHCHRVWTWELWLPEVFQMSDIQTVFIVVIHQWLCCQTCLNLPQHRQLLLIWMTSFYFGEVRQIFICWWIGFSITSFWLHSVCVVLLHWLVDSSYCIQV